MAAPQTARIPEDPYVHVRTLAQLEREECCRALRRTGGRVRPAARLLGIGFMTLYRKIRRYEITDRDWNCRNRFDTVSAARK